jgi:outer membrane protein TolC
MVWHHLARKLVLEVICGMAILFGLAGCSRTDYKKDADERVYKIIDQKWKDEFGPKSNYKVSDVTPSPNDIAVERTAPVTGVLTLQEAVAKATAHNRDYQLQKEELYAKALDLRLIRHNFERVYYGRPKGTYGKVQGVNYVGAGAGVEARFPTNRMAADLPHLENNPPGTGWHLEGDEIAITDGFGFDQLLTDGTMIGANVGLAWGRLLNGALKGESIISVLSFEVTRPLLRGSDRRVVMEGLTQAERDTLYQVRIFNRFRKTFIVSVISQYYLVLQAYDTVKNARRNYNTLDWLYERAENLANAGRLPQFELDGISQDKLIALDAYIEAEKEYKLLLDQFKIILGLPTTAEFQLDPNELGVLRAAELVEPDFAETEAVETALCRRLDLINSADAVTDAQRKVFVAADGLKAQVDLGVNTNIPLQDLSSSNAKVFQDLFLSGLQVDLPFDRTAEQNIYRKALITVNQKQREYELATDTIALEVRQAYCELKEETRRYKVQSEQLVLAQKRLKNTFLLMQYGRASSRRVLDAQRDLFDAQNTATEALVAYTVATLNFYRDTEVLRVRPDGMWSTAGGFVSAQKTTPSP